MQLRCKMFAVNEIAFTENWLTLLSRMTMYYIIQGIYLELRQKCRLSHALLNGMLLHFPDIKTRLQKTFAFLVGGWPFHHFACMVL